MSELAAAWAILTASLIIAAPVIFLKIKDTTSLEQDLKFSDATFEEVAPTAEIEEQHEAQAHADAAWRESNTAAATDANATKAAAESDESEKK
jgi:hypothetical protein